MISTTHKLNTTKARALACIRANDLTQARSLYEEAVRLVDTDAESWFMLGAIHGQQGRIAESVACGRRAVAADPGHLLAHYNLGQAQLHLGDVAGAIDSYRRVVALDPKNIEAHNQLGYALQCAGRYQESLAPLRAAIAARPGFAEAHNNLGIGLCALGDCGAAIDCYREALRLNPRYAQAHYNLGLAYKVLHATHAAIDSFRAAIRISPQYAEAHNNLGTTLTDFGDHEGAERHFRTAIQMKPDFFEAHNNLAHALVLLGRFDEALEAYQAAQRIRPDSLDPVAGLASVHERRREYRQAFEVLWPHIDAGAEHVGVVTAAAGLCRRFNRCDQVAALAERILESHATAERDRAALHFQLGQIYDRRQEFERAFVHFQQGNRLKQDQFDIDAHRAVVDELIEVFGREGLARMPRASRSAERVVLVVGMPRSGTSLVEQILASHPAVFGAGELPDIGHLTLRLPALPGRSTGYPRTVTGISQSQLDDLAAAYHDRLRQLSPDARRVTDKMPQNFLHLGFVELLFPQAKIIHCLRDPMDSCLSCYFHLFGGYHPYAYDLRDLGLYYREYRRLMAHWKTALSLPMLEIAYEDVVDRQEEMSRALVAFCGLDWDEACLRFHLSERYVNTASYDQVRRPIYRDSVARWRHYENHLGPLRDALGDAGAHVHHAGAS